MIPENWILVLISLCEFSLSDAIDIQCPALKKCRCGTRNDDISYVYCARQDLKIIPQFYEHSDEAWSYIFDEFLLNGNKITKINIDSFHKSIYRVRLIDLSDNPITNIDTNAFNPTKFFLHSLKISFASDIIVLQTDWLRPLKSLRFLQITNVKVTSNIYIPKSVKHLVLQQGSYDALFTINNNHTIGRSIEQNFDFLPKMLITLNLDHWKNVEKIVFPTLHLLQNLSLVSNGISSVNRIRSLPNLKSLDLSFNVIQSMESIHLIKIQLIKLETLNLRHNLLTADAINNPSVFNGIKVLILDFNPLKSLFTIPESVTDLSARHTLLRLLKRSWFDNAHNLISLDLQSNPSMAIDLDCFALYPVAKSLLYLNIAGLESSSVDQNVKCLLQSMVDSNTRLQTLNIRNTGIMDVPSSLTKLQDLQSLDLSDNSMITFEWHHLPQNLQNLYADNISSHVLKKTDLNFLKLPRSLEILYFNDNPFIWQEVKPTYRRNIRNIIANMLINCDCTALSLFNWLKKDSDLSSSIQCQLNSMELSDMSEKDLKCINKTSLKDEKLMKIVWQVYVEHIPNKHLLAKVIINWDIKDESIKGFEVSASEQFKPRWTIISPFLDYMQRQYIFPSMNITDDSKIEFCLSIYKFEGIERRCKEYTRKGSRLDGSKYAVRNTGELLREELKSNSVIKQSRHGTISVYSCLFCICFLLFLIFIIIMTIQRKYTNSTKSRKNARIRSSVKRKSLFQTKNSALDNLLFDSTSSFKDQPYGVTSKATRTQTCHYLTLCRHCTEEQYPLQAIMYNPKDINCWHCCSFVGNCATNSDDIHYYQELEESMR
ncbi:hypothetical protein GJ496_008167 [Pomphorhynchus laevis]|nr:hypothetical protein GJ496_008167 [Pomphorhynchus laevis]